MLDDDAILAKYKNAKMPDATIAARMGITEEEVGIRWKRLLEAAVVSEKAGRLDLAQQLNHLALQYQLVGESLKIVTLAFGDAMTPTEVRALVSDDPDETVKNLFQHAILLRPFKAVDPIESLKAHVKKN